MFNITDFNLDNFHFIPSGDITAATTAENQSETIDYSTISDSTSVGDVIQFVNQYTFIDNKVMFASIDNFLNAPGPYDESGKENLTDIGVSLLHELNRMFTLAECGIDAVFARNAITRGQILTKLKELVRKAGHSWGKWAEDTFPLLSEHTRVDNMKLASRPDCYPYYFLGGERLLMLIRATYDFPGEDKIGQFMAKYNIKYSLQSRETLKDFKMLVDAAINSEKLEKALENSTVKAEPQLVRSLTRFTRVMDNNLLMDAKKIGESGGDVNKYFEKLVINKGKIKSPFDITRSINDFNSTAVKLTQLIDYILKNEDTVETIDTKIFARLHEKLRALKTFANIKEEGTNHDTLSI